MCLQKFQNLLHKNLIEQWRIKMEKAEILKRTFRYSPSYATENQKQPVLAGEIFMDEFLSIERRFIISLG